MLLKIKNLKLQTILGVHLWEEKINREIIINVEIESDFVKSLQSDDINDTIDYDLITTKIKNLIASKRFKLVETMAQNIMDEIMQDSRVKRCKIEIDKVGAVEAVESFSVTIEQYGS
ncbi:MAG: dihydroneopterin aldolase [Pseudomonadota bacterium]